MPSPIINLNVFTNVASDNAEHCLAPEAVLSFFSCFNRPDTGFDVVMRLFIDPKPHRANYDAWVDIIRERLPDIKFDIVPTEGLVSGFWKSIDLSEGEYAVQLEHDFVFIRERINHSLVELTNDMRQRAINFVRFNKRRNVPVGYDLFMEGDETGAIPLSRINGRSNNPQIIDVAYYRSLLAKIPGMRELGLEGGLCRHAGGGYLYGEPGWPKTVQHLDGRRIRTKDGLARAFYLLRERGLASLGVR